MAFRQVITDAPGQIYVSALLFSPLKSIVREAFDDMVPQWINLRLQADQTWSPCLQALDCDGYSVTQVRFLSDGNLVTGDERHWKFLVLDSCDPKGGNCFSDLNEPAQEGYRKVLSPDGRLIASVTNDDVFHIWDWQDGEYRFEIELQSSVKKVVFSPNSQLVALELNGVMKLMDTQDGRFMSSLQIDFERTTDRAFSPDNKWFVHSLGFFELGLWLVRTGKHHATLEGTTPVAFSHDSNLLAFQSKHRLINFWDFSAETCRPALRTHSDYSSNLMFSPDDQLLASMSAGREGSTVDVWNPRTGECHITLQGRTMAFSHDGSVLAVGDRDGVTRLWNIPKAEYGAVFHGHTAQVETVCFSPDGRLLASGSFDRTVRVWDLQASGFPSDNESHDQFAGVNEVSYSPNKQLVACSHWKHRQGTLWNARTGDRCYVLEGEGPSFSANSQLCLSSSQDGTVRLLDVQNLTCRSFTKGYYSVFSLDSRLVASASSDHSINVWDAKTGDEQRILRGHSNTVWSLAFSTMNNLVASTSKDRTARLWSLQTGECTLTIEDDITSLFFAPNSQILASVCGVECSKVQLWDTDSVSVRFNISVSDHDVHFRREITFSPDSRFVASDMTDKTVRLWDTQTEECILKIPYFPDKPRVEFGVGSKLVFVDGMAHSIKSADNSEAEKAELNCQVPDLRIGPFGHWVWRSSEKLLWLPPEWRGDYHAAYKNQIVIGCPSGRVTFLWLENELDNYDYE